MTSGNHFNLGFDVAMFLMWPGKMIVDDFKDHDRNIIKTHNILVFVCYSLWAFILMLFTMQFL
jgi:hypothetical protein